MNTFQTFLHTFSKLSFDNKVACAATASGAILTATYIASTDTVQKAHIKYKLLNMKSPKPQHMERVNFILFKVASVAYL